jgi:hypothetical protein
MDIRFVSTLTGDDESHFAPALLQAITAVLDVMPIAYTIRIETVDAQVFQHTNPPAPSFVEPNRKSVSNGVSVAGA